MQSDPVIRSDVTHAIDESKRSTRSTCNACFPELHNAPLNEQERSSVQVAAPAACVMSVRVRPRSTCQKRASPRLLCEFRNYVGSCRRYKHSSATV